MTGGRSGSAAFKTVVLRRSAAAEDSQTFVPRAVLGLSSHSSRWPTGQACGFRPAAIRGRAQRTTLVRRTMLMRQAAPSSYECSHRFQCCSANMPDTLFRKLLRLLFGLPRPPESRGDSFEFAADQKCDDEPPGDSVVDTGTHVRRLPGLEADRFTSQGTVGQRPATAAPPKKSDSRTRAEVSEASALRRKAHQRAVKARFESDIVFLGRGVSRGLADRQSDPDRLQEHRLPKLSTPADVAVALQLSVSKLRWLAFHKDMVTRSHYYSFRIPRKNGKPRTLQAPHRTLAYVQGWILDEILYQLPVHQAAHGFVPNRSVVTNAKPHLGAQLVINTDLTDFFPTITFARVNGLFHSLGYSPAVATILALLCTEAPREELVDNGTRYEVAVGPRALPQGACTSPAISNLIARTLDRRMTGMAEVLGWTYTRYADDITWSAQQFSGTSVGYVLARIRQIVDDEGFSINDQKTRVLRPNQRQSVTGIAVNDRLSVPRKTIRRVRAILHNAQFTGLEAQNRDAHPHFEHWLLGMIGWIHMVQPENANKLRSRLDQLRTRSTDPES